MRGATVSTIVPAYNAGRTIRRAVDSLLAQTRPPDEILVVDDGSAEDLAAALEPYGDRVLLVRQSHGGAARARNRGIEWATGDLIAFLDADDYWEPTKLERQLIVFEQHRDVGLVATRYYVQEPGQNRVEDARLYGGMVDRPLRLSGAAAFDGAAQVWTTTVVVRRSVLGEHRFESGLEPAEDRDLWIRIVMEQPVYVVGAFLATQVLEPGSLSRSNVDRDCSNMLRVVHRHGDLLGQQGLRRWEGAIYRRWAGEYLGTGRPSKALWPAWHRLRRQPLAAEAWWILFKSAALACTRWNASPPRELGGADTPAPAAGRGAGQDTGSVVECTPPQGAEGYRAAPSGR
jgi:glycosyltransferase involved in cell wall biosynthesis